MAGDVTTGELGRRLDVLALEIREWRKSGVSRAEYEADREASERRITTLEVKVAAMEAAAAQAERERQRDAGQRRFSIVAMIAGPIIAALIAWVVAGGLVR